MRALIYKYLGAYAAEAHANSATAQSTDIHDVQNRVLCNLHTTMSTTNLHLDTLAGNWLGKLSPTMFVILSFLWSRAAESKSKDGKVRYSIQEIATATKLA
jgi:adenylate kinase